MSSERFLKVWSGAFLAPVPMVIALLVVAAAEKLATAAPFKVAPLEAVDVLVTEDAVSDAHASDLESHGIEVLRA